ncbi:hypothetical protein I0P70_17265 [Pontibacter sp. FD36]|uniref:DUF6843 domain-containing protein n=1 Tax=Pontibacter sp. FD36 TaxID=2789860 RepID=UPI0018ABF117|nr:hypothetical protein [Pontibacter sp. FD36]MBF8965000.1 hypothetical protein [Pontibacter sp. FD36]
MKSKIGITIIVLAFAVSWNPYWLIFAVPAFLIGVVTLWLSKKKLSAKLGWTFVPIVLWYPGFMLFMYLSMTIGQANAQNLDFIFPKDFKGTAVVISNMPCGAPVKKVSRREVLNIPEDGILLYQGTIEAGYIDHRYFRKNNAGQLNAIKSLENYMFWDDQENPPPTNKVGVFLGGMGSTVSNDPESVKYEWMSLIVSSKDSLENFNDFGYNNQMSERAEALVRNCTNK